MYNKEKKINFPTFSYFSLFKGNLLKAISRNKPSFFVGFIYRFYRNYNVSIMLTFQTNIKILAGKSITSQQFRCDFIAHSVTS